MGLYSCPVPNFAMPKEVMKSTSETNARVGTDLTSKTWPRPHATKRVDWVITYNADLAAANLVPSEFPNIASSFLPKLVTTKFGVVMAQLGDGRKVYGAEANLIVPHHYLKSRLLQGPHSTLCVVLSSVKK